MSYFDDASLVMIPSGYKTSKVYSVKPTDGSGDLTFSRSNDTATRVGPDGLIEKVRTNLILQSQNLASASWSLIGTATRTANYGIAPDGTQTSTRIQYDGVSSFELFQYTGVATPVYGSIYVKGTAGQTLRFNGVNRTLTGGWQRIEGGLPIDGSNTYITIQGFAGLTALDYELWGAQAERGDIATDYIATTSAAVSVGPVANVPRLDYLNSSCPRLLLEPQRTNLVTYSEQFNNAAWGKASSGTALAPVVTANNAISPDGYQNADTIVFDAGAGTTSSDSSALFQTFGGTTATYTGSFYAKTASGTAQIQVRIDGGPYDKFTITNQWQRFTLTKALTGTSNTFEMVIRRGLNEPMNASATIQLWGVQVELGAYATSYIPTLGAAVTRGADAAYKTGISSLIPQTEGVIFVEGVMSQIPNDFLMLRLAESGGVFNNSQNITVTSSRAINASSFNNGASQASITSSALAAGSTFKAAFAFKNNDFALYVNGTQIGVDTSGIMPSGNSEVLVGSYYPATSNNETSIVKQALVFKTRLTNAQLAELTTI